MNIEQIFPILQQSAEVTNGIPLRDGLFRET
jgi:hypothetical protein